MCAVDTGKANVDEEGDYRAFNVCVHVCPTGELAFQDESHDFY